MGQNALENGRNGIKNQSSRKKPEKGLNSLKSPRKTHTIVSNKLCSLLGNDRSCLHEFVQEDLSSVHQNRFALVHRFVVETGQSDETGEQFTGGHHGRDGLLRLAHRLDSRLDGVVQLLDRVN